MYTIAIVDDDKQDIEALEKVINRYFKENPEGGGSSLSAFADGSEFLKDYSPQFDLVFLDIDMKSVNGMETARRIRAAGDKTAIIFVTRMARYAIRGYDVQAIDFIVKPVDYYSFSLKFKKALDYVDSNREKRISLRQEDSLVWLNVGDVVYVEVLNHYLIWHTTRGTYKIWSTLKQAEEQLRGEAFALCNRCYLVNLRFVHAIDKNLADVGSEKLVISRYKRKEFIERLAAFWGSRG